MVLEPPNREIEISATPGPFRVIPFAQLGIFSASRAQLHHGRAQTTRYPPTYAPEGPKIEIVKK